MEVAVIKRLRAIGYPRDLIFSYLARPGRKLTPACIAEVEQGKIGRNIDPATDPEAMGFIARRMAESRDGKDGSFGPLSSLQIGETLGVYVRAQGNLFIDESQVVEFKQEVESKKLGLIGLAKTIAAFANAKGGYIFIGVTDNREIVGISREAARTFPAEQLSQLTQQFQPTPSWDWTVYEWQDRPLVAIYTYEAETKPIIAAKETANVREGEIYFRYRGMSSPIKAGDLAELLRERDEKTRKRTISDLKSEV